MSAEQPRTEKYFEVRAFSVYYLANAFLNTVSKSGVYLQRIEDKAAKRPWDTCHLRAPRKIALALLSRYDGGSVPELGV